MCLPALHFAASAQAFKEDVLETTGADGKKYKLLPPYIRLIQGDGISYETLGEILKAVAEKGYAADNLVFGSGGALLQKLHRDTQKCAFKCSEITDSKGQTTKVYKDPITDKGKQSKKGKLTLEPGPDGKLITKTEGTGDPSKVGSRNVPAVRRSRCTQRRPPLAES